MSSNMRVFYLYVVSLIALIIFVSGIIAVVYNGARLAFPTSYVFYEDKMQNNYYLDGEIKTAVEKDYDSNNTIKEQKENKIRISNYKKEAVKDIIVSLLVIGIGFILYNYHWKTIERERNMLEN